MKTVVVAFSGGLDTSFCVVWLREELGLRVVTAYVDTGGADAAARAAIEARALSLGAAEHHAIDARDAVWSRFLAYVIKGNVLRGGVYPVSVAAERTAQAEAVAGLAQRLGADAVAHGSTGAGNDQVRFDVALTALLPGVTILTPVRDLNWPRSQAAAWLAERGVPVAQQTVDYSINAGLVGTTIGGKQTHDPWSEPPDHAWTATLPPTATSRQPAEVVVAFEHGLPVALDGVRLSGVALLAELEERCHPHGVGRGLHVGDTILGLKGRIAFEAPGPLVLIDAHHELGKLVLSKWQAHWLDQAGAFWGMLLHEGHYHDPVMRDLEALLDSANRLVTGEARVRLFAGAHRVVGTRSPASLLDADVAVYGEGTGSFDGRDAKGFARLWGLQTLLCARRDARLHAANATPPSAQTQP